MATAFTLLQVCHATLRAQASGLLAQPSRLRHHWRADKDQSNVKLHLSTRQTERRRRLLFGQGFYGDHILIFERTGSTELHTLRISVAEVAVVSDTFVRRKSHHAKRAGKQAHLAADATIGNNFDLAVGLPLDRYGSTNRRTGCVGTMDAHHRLIELLLIEISNANTRERRLEGTLM